MEPGPRLGLSALARSPLSRYRERGTAAWQAGGCHEPLGDGVRDTRIACPERCETWSGTGPTSAVEELWKLDRGVKSSAEKEGDDCHLSAQTVQRLFQARALVGEECRKHALEQPESLEAAHLRVQRATPPGIGTSMPDQDQRALPPGKAAQGTVPNGRSQEWVISNRLAERDLEADVSAFPTPDPFSQP